jgi:hypothetical protein
MPIDYCGLELQLLEIEQYLLPEEGRAMRDY